jgi:hypothetical protein
MEASRRQCWDLSQGQLFSLGHMSTANGICSIKGTIHLYHTLQVVSNSMGFRPFTCSQFCLGFLADFAASIVYVPSEVLKTRLQLQGQYNNPFFNSGYNYKSTWDAAKTIARTEGFGALYSGYKATIVRDLPFSALQFAFYEQERKFAQQWQGTSEIGLGFEVLTAVSAGGAAGVITCPLDVVKTRTQTQITPDPSKSSQSSRLEKEKSKAAKSSQKVASKTQTRLIHSGPRTVPHHTPLLNTSSIIEGLRMIYKTEGVAGMFRGVGPRFVWTSVQSGTMLVLYQYLLKQMERFQAEEGSGVI